MKLHNFEVIKFGKLIIQAFLHKQLLSLKALE
jgi:hypothetical protein